MSWNASNVFDFKDPLWGYLLPLIERLPLDPHSNRKLRITANTGSSLVESGIYGFVHAHHGKPHLPLPSSVSCSRMVSASCHSAVVSIGDKIREARKAKKISQDRLAKLMRPPVTKNAVTNWEKNNNMPSSQNLRQLTSILERSYEWLTSEAEAMNFHTRKVPLVGYVGAGDKAHYYNDGQGPYDEVDAPAGAGPTTVAVEVRGDSMRGYAENHWLLFYDDVRDPPTDDLLGRLCIVGLMDDRILVKKLMKGRGPGYFHLYSSNADPMLDEVVQWAARVVWIQPR